MIRYVNDGKFLQLKCVLRVYLHRAGSRRLVPEGSSHPSPTMVLENASVALQTALCSPADYHVKFSRGRHGTVNGYMFWPSCLQVVAKRSMVNSRFIGLCVTSWAIIKHRSMSVARNRLNNSAVLVMLLEIQAVVLKKECTSACSTHGGGIGKVSHKCMRTVRAKPVAALSPTIVADTFENPSGGRIR